MKNIKYVCVIDCTEKEPLDKNSHYVFCNNKSSASDYGKAFVNEKIKEFKNKNKGMLWSEAKKNYLNTPGRYRFEIMTVEDFFTKNIQQKEDKAQAFYKSYFNACYE